MRREIWAERGSSVSLLHGHEPTDDQVRAFVRSMPPHYRGYDSETVQAHAAIAESRGTLRVRLAAWRRLTGGGVAICVVAPDRPGLLSLIAAAMTSHDLDVMAAQIYTRSLPSEESEALDLFWLRRRPLARRPRDITNDELEQVESLLADLVGGDELAERLIERTVVDVSYSAPGLTWVRFDDDRDGASVLVVQTYDRPGLLLTVSRALFCVDVQVVRSEVNTTQGRVLDRFHIIDFNGRTIAEEKRSDIERAVLEALENLGRGFG
jgi:[protein-PII] uridylyltransferase